MTIFLVLDCWMYMEETGEKTLFSLVRCINCNSFCIFKLNGFYFVVLFFFEWIS